eukprot:COSAG02_NODE_2866_length_7865_cov_7.555498_6_plen_46_part_00
MILAYLVNPSGAAQMYRTGVPKRTTAQFESRHASGATEDESCSIL